MLSKQEKVFTLVSALLGLLLAAIDQTIVSTVWIFHCPTWHLPLNQKRIEFLCWLGMPQSLRWLDVGCGIGALSETIVKLCGPTELTGVDPSEGFLTKARARLQRNAIREAARRLGVSSGAPFRHFPDREALLRAVAVEGFRRMSTEMERRMRGVKESPLAQFREMGVAYVVFAAKHLHLFRVMYRPECAVDSLSNTGSNKNIMSLLSHAQNEGAIASKKNEIIMLTAQALVYGLARMIVDAPERPSIAKVEEQARAVTGVLGEGLLPQG